MRAAVLRDGAIAVRDDVPEPVPGAGQVLVQVKACGICGSDLHFAEHGADALALGKQIEGVPRDHAAPEPLDLSRDVFLGHEFAGEILEVGPDTDTLPVGTPVVSYPVLLRADGPAEQIVYSNRINGGYGERLLLSAPLLLRVPNGLPLHLAALTEPMSVGLHGVNRSRIEQDETAVVLGCGPVGLAVVAALKVRGVKRIIAADLSPARRALAEVLGATDVVDPRDETAWTRAGVAKPLVVFEAIGVPGVLDDILRCAPSRSRVIVVGVCMNNDTINPYFGVSKELSVEFVLGYSRKEFAASLRSIAEGEIDVAPLVTARIGLDEVQWAFGALRNPEEHCKIIVEP